MVGARTSSSVFFLDSSDGNERFSTPSGNLFSYALEAKNREIDELEGVPDDAGRVVFLPTDMWIWSASHCQCHHHFQSPDELVCSPTTSPWPKSYVRVIFLTKNVRKRNRDVSAL